MAYKAEINRANPTCVIFLIDQSGSMIDELVDGTSKAQFVADALNKTLLQMVVSCKRQEGINDYFDVGVLAYFDQQVVPGLGGNLQGSHVVPISQIANHPVRIETRKKKVSDNAGGFIEREAKFPVWFDPISSGGTPMCAGLRTTGDLLQEWCKNHKNSFPPVVIHLTDGQATDGTDGDVAAAAKHLISQGTDDGNAILLNVHIEGGEHTPIRFPTSEDGLPASAKTLFSASSIMPSGMVDFAQTRNIPNIQNGSRAFVYRGGVEEILHCFDIGTKQKTLQGPAADR